MSRFLQLAAYALIFWTLSTSLTAPNPRVLFGPDQTVITQVPQLCVHTRLIDEVEEWVIQRSLVMVREMGAAAIVEFFPWSYIERTPGQFDWQQADRIIGHARNQGLQVIARLGMVPAWAQQSLAGTEIIPTHNTLPESSFQQFADYAAAFAQRYAADVHQLIIWNEPNLAFEWGYQQVSPETYTSLLRTVYHTVKQGTPEISILGGALASTLEPEGSPNGMNELRYLERMLQAGAAQVMDAFAVHTYGFRQEPQQEPAPDQINFRRPELLFALLKEYGAHNLPVYVTEMGWNDHPRWALAVSPSRRISYTLDALQYALENWKQVEHLCIWAFRFPLPTLGYPDHFTLVATDFQPRPIYYALQQFALDQQQQEALWLPPPLE